MVFWVLTKIVFKSPIGTQFKIYIYVAKIERGEKVNEDVMGRA